MEDSTLNQTPNTLEKLCRLVDTLRGENGCPWDRKQTPESVAVYVIEEVFELVDAIESGDPKQVREELGDVLFHIVFIARMFEEREEFDLSEVARAITEKMIRRHPHVFGDMEVNSTAEVIQNWHKIKVGEKRRLKNRSQLDSVPAKLPALIRAYRIMDRVAKSGFEWHDTTAKRNIKNELESSKLMKALNQYDGPLTAGEIGDLLFALVDKARRSEIHPEGALARSVKIFEARFKKMEEVIADSRREFDEVSIEEKRLIWEKVQKLIPAMD